MNRKIITQIAALYFAPTENNKRNLENENIRNHVYITGNTVIDAFKYTVKKDYQFKDPLLQKIDFNRSRFVVMTAHRRENIGQPLENICHAVKHLIVSHPEIEVIYPVHLNPAVRETVFNILGQVERVHLIDPIDVEDMHNVISRSYLVMTDSGGLQEEAPSFGVPVIVLRTETERPEAIEAGTVTIGGTNEEQIYELADKLLSDEQRHSQMAHAINPYGDGHASERIAKAILGWKSDVRKC